MEIDKKDYKVLFKVFSNDLIISILTILSSRDSYPREISRILGVSETTVSRKLRYLERIGIVESKWKYVRGRNAKIYRLVVREFIVLIKPSGITIVVNKGVEGKERSYVKDTSYSSTIPCVKGFIGRTRELDLLHNSEKPVVVIWGFKGVGKTSLVAKYVGSLNKPVLWINLDPSIDLANILWRIALFSNTLGFSKILDHLKGYLYNTSNSIELLVEFLNKNDVVIVFDNYSELVDYRVKVFIHNIISRIKNSKIIVISRELPEKLVSSSNVFTLRLHGLDFTDALKFVRERGVVINEKDFLKIYELSKGIPVLLLLFIDSLKDGGFDREYIDHYCLYIVDSIWRLYYSDLGSDEKRVVEILATLMDSVPKDLFKEIGDIEDPSVVVRELLLKGFIDVVNEHVSLHDIFRFIGSRLSSSKRSMYYRIAGDYYRVNARDFYDLLKAIEYYIDSGCYNSALDIIKERLYSGGLHYSLYARKYLSLLNKLVDRVDDKEIILCEKGSVESSLGYYGDALEDLRSCLESLKGASDEYLLVHVLLQLLRTHIDLGSADSIVGEIVKEVRNRTSFIRESGDYRLLYRVYNELALVELFRGNPREALKYVLKAHGIAKGFGEQFYNGLTMLYLGITYMYLNNYSKAYKCFKKAVRVFNSISDNFHRAVSEFLLANTLLYFGRVSKASEYASRSYLVFRGCKNIGWTTRSLILLSMISLWNNCFDEVIDYTAKALLLDSSGLSNSLNRAKLLNIIAKYLKTSDPVYLKKLVRAGSGSFRDVYDGGVFKKFIREYLTRIGEEDLMNKLFNQIQQPP